MKRKYLNISSVFQGEVTETQKWSLIYSQGVARPERRTVGNEIR